MHSQLTSIYEKIRGGLISNEEAIDEIMRIENTGNEIETKEIENAVPILKESYRYDEPYIRDHSVDGKRVIIGATFVSLAINAFFRKFPDESDVSLRRILFMEPVELTTDSVTEVEIWTKKEKSSIAFDALYRCDSSAEWRTVATGQIQKGMLNPKQIDLEKQKGNLVEIKNLDTIYSQNPIVRLGEHYRIIRRLYAGNEFAAAQVVVSGLADARIYALDPVVINSIFLTASVFERESECNSYLPFSIEEINYHHVQGTDEIWLFLKLIKDAGEVVVFNAELTSSDGAVLAEFIGCSLKKIRSGGATQPAGAIKGLNSKAIPGKLDAIGDRVKAINLHALSKQTESYLMNKVQELFGDRIKAIRVDGNLMELGLESAQLIALTKTIERDLGIEMAPTIMFEYPNINELVGFLSESHPNLLHRFFNNNRKIEKSENEDIASTVRKSYEEILPLVSNVKNDLRNDNDIAVIGMHGIFPDAPDVNAFWKNLCEQRDVMREIPIDRWDFKPWYNESGKAADSTYCKWGSFIDGADKFDAEFFNISRREAEWMDPQLRLLLQSVYLSGEDAGHVMRNTNSGVFIGVCFHDYLDKINELSLPLDPFVGTGNSQTVLANRISYYLNLTGPSIAIDTSCSSSLVALHLACQALRNGECSAAFVGGANLLLSSLHYRYFSSIGALSHSGRCHSFDAAADGYTPGECIASVLLKPLAKAVSDRDHIYAVIKGSSALHGGYTPSLTAPSVSGEENTLLGAWKNAMIPPETITYVEAHGTGTKLGDPIEIASLTKAFARFTNKQNFCHVGSVKANIGHAEGAAGIAGLIKVILQLRHGKIPAMPGFKELNPYIKIDKTALAINREMMEWASDDGVPRRAGISSFGFSGAFAHIVVEDKPETVKSDLENRFLSNGPSFILLSARSERQLTVQAERLVKYLDDSAASDDDMRNIAFTLQVGREAMAERLALEVTSISDLRSKLKLFIERDPADETLKADWFRGRLGRKGDSLLGTLNDEEKSALAKNWIKKGDFAKVLSLWVNGFSFDWTSLYSGESPRRLSMPGYPFAEERFWITDLINTQADSMPKESKPDMDQAICTIGTDDINRLQDQKEEALEASSEKNPVAPDKAEWGVIEKLRRMIAAATRSSYSVIDAETPFEEMGIDSIIINELNSRIEQWLGRRDSTLLFRHSTIRGLAAHICRQFPRALTELSDINGAAPDAPASGIGNSEIANKPVTFRDQVVPQKNKSGRPIVAPLDIAIIGMAGRFPGADNPDEFWLKLIEGKDLVGEIPPERWQLDGFFESNRVKAVEQVMSFGKWGGFINDFDTFDPLFFGISPREAKFMDPQERKFLEVAWECFEDAGYCREILHKAEGSNRIGVFAGVTFNNYQLRMSDEAWKNKQGMYPVNSQTYSIANRVSYVMNLTGPSLTIDTACSSSLYALHLACESIALGQSDLAIAGGVNLSLHPSKYITLSQAQFLATDGRCRAFCEGGTGYVPAEAVGVVLLKPLQEAINDRDHIYGVVKGCGVSHAGKTNGFTVPSPTSQSLAVEMALQQSRIPPRHVSFIEAHGTGTALGDPIEITGLSDVFSKYTADKQFCSISSVKTNIGHAEAAAGIVQVVKVLLQFKHETLVKNLMHGSGPNPNIDFMQTPFFVQTKNEFWKRQSIEGREVARVAGISSFGAGGSNAHVVIEEYRPQCEEVCSPDNRPSLIVLSAKNKDQLRKVMERLHLAVQNGSLSHFTLQEIAYTLQVGREPLDERVAMVVESVDQLNEKLRMILSDGTQQNGVVFGHCNRGGNVQPVMMNGSRIGDVEKKPFSEGELFALSEAWTQGARIDWNRIYGEKKPKLVSLPTYPFARERYWLSLIKPKGQSIEQVQATRVAPATQTQKPVTSTPGVLSADKYNSLTRDVAENSGQTPATHFVGRPSLQLTPIDGQLTDDDKAKRSINVAFDKPKEVVLKNITEMGGAEDVDASAVTSRKDAIASPGRPEEIDSRRAPVAKDTVENLHSWLSNSLKEVLLIDDKAIDIDKKFVDMGLDSIVGVEWVQTINKQYGLSISATKLYDYPTIREMASFVESETSKNLCMSGPPLREDLTIDEILMRIAQNTLSVDQAERMLCQATADKSGMHLNDVNPTIPPDVRQQHVKSTREVSQTQIFHEGAGDSEGAGFEDIVRNLAKGLAQALCIAEKDIDTDKKFTDMGLDSIIGVEWIQSINRTYGCSISATKLYDYPTLLEFAEFLKGELIVSPREVVKENGSAIRRNGAELGDALPANCKQEKSGGQKAVLSFQEVVDELKVTLAEALYMEKEKVDSDKNFVDMGLDSIIGVEWMQTINKRFNISVSATKIYDYPNIRKLSEYLAAEIPLVAIAH